MPIGDDKDFRMVGFQQVQLFPGQDHLGGVGSPMLEEITGGPFGGSNFQNPSSPGTTIALGNNNFTFPAVTLPTVQPPVINVGGGGGATTPQLLLTGGSVTVPTSVSQIDFTGTGLLSLTVSGGIATVNYQDTGGSSSGSVLVYGRISSSTKNATLAIWTYNVALLFPGAGNVTAYNLLEENNSSTVAYGYTLDTNVAARDKILSTNYRIYGVPNGTLVRMELTNSMTSGGALQYWFSAPNFIDGGC